MPCRRKVYDQTGDLTDAEELTGENFDDLYKYYGDLYKEVTEADIDQFASQFRGSDEEAAEVLQYYERFKGDMHQVHSRIYMPRLSTCALTQESAADGTIDLMHACCAGV